MMNTDYIETQKRYWNQEEIVEHFRKGVASDYWIKFINETDIQGKILDLGCGGCRNFSYFAGQGFDVYGCDLHEHMVETSRKMVEDIVKPYNYADRVIKANVLELPYQDNMFEAVIANGLYHNLESIEHFRQAISETARVIEEGGYLCLNMFDATTVDESLTKMDIEYLYMTPDVASMILLPSKLIIQILSENRLINCCKILHYSRKVFSGERSVLRSVFQKRKHGVEKEEGKKVYE